MGAKAIWTTADELRDVALDRAVWVFQSAEPRRRCRICGASVWEGTNVDEWDDDAVVCDACKKEQIDMARKVLDPIFADILQDAVENLKRS